jgi:hypothetical protein
VSSTWTSCDTDVLVTVLGVTRPSPAGSRSFRSIAPLTLRCVPLSNDASRTPSVIFLPSRFEVTLSVAFRWVGVSVESGARKAVVVPTIQPMVAPTSSVAETVAESGSILRPALWPTVPKSNVALVLR